MKTYHVARLEDGHMTYFAGFAPGGDVMTSDREHAVNFWQRGTADAFRSELNNREDSRRWFTVEIVGDVF